MSWKQKLTSRKFWTAVVSAALVIANEGLGLNIPQDVVLPFALLILGYIFSEAAVDVANALKK